MTPQLVSPGPSSFFPTMTPGSCSPFTPAEEVNHSALMVTPQALALPRRLIDYDDKGQEGEDEYESSVLDVSGCREGDDGHEDNHDNGDEPEGKSEGEEARETAGSETLSKLSSGGNGLVMCSEATSGKDAKEYSKGSNDRDGRADTYLGSSDAGADAASASASAADVDTRYPLLQLAANSSVLSEQRVQGSLPGVSITHVSPISPSRYIDQSRDGVLYDTVLHLKCVWLGRRRPSELVSFTVALEYVLIYLI